MKTRLSALYPFVLGIALLSVANYLWPQTRIDPDQMKAPTVAVLTCNGATSPTSDCTGLYYVDVVTAAGTELKIIGPVATAGATLDPKVWSVVP